jgi:hypothetical protein
VKGAAAKDIDDALKAFDDAWTTVKEDNLKENFANVARRTEEFTARVDELGVDGGRKGQGRPGRGEKEAVGLPRPHEERAFMVFLAGVWGANATVGLSAASTAPLAAAQEALDRGDHRAARTGRPGGAPKSQGPSAPAYVGLGRSGFGARSGVAGPGLFSPGPQTGRALRPRLLGAGASSRKARPVGRSRERVPGRGVGGPVARRRDGSPGPLERAGGFKGMREVLTPRGWWNWQTRKPQELMAARLCRFKSCPAQCEDPLPNVTTVARNRRAHHKYAILETFDGGLALTGPEVKSVRAGELHLEDGFGRVEKRRNLPLERAHQPVPGGFPARDAGTHAKAENPPPQNRDRSRSWAS